VTGQFLSVRRVTESCQPGQPTLFRGWSASSGSRFTRGART